MIHLGYSVILKLFTLDIIAENTNVWKNKSNLAHQKQISCLSFKETVCLRHWQKDWYQKIFPTINIT